MSSNLWWLAAPTTALFVGWYLLDYIPSGQKVRPLLDDLAFRMAFRDLTQSALDPLRDQKAQLEMEHFVLERERDALRLERAALTLELRELGIEAPEIESR